MYRFCDEAAHICKAWELDRKMAEEARCENFHGNLMRYYAACGHYSAKLKSGMNLIEFDDHTYLWHNVSEHWVVDRECGYELARPEDYC